MLPWLILLLTAPNEGMELGPAGQPPDGWVQNSYGEVAAALVRDDQVAHEGWSSLRLRCAAFRGGAAQAYLPCGAVTAGATYTLRGWIRADGLSAPVDLMVRDIGPPYHSYLAASQLATEVWRPIAAIGQADQDGGEVAIFLRFQSAGTVWLDDLELLEGEHPFAAQPPAAVEVEKGNLVQNSGFETGLQGWTMPERLKLESGGVAGSRCVRWIGPDYALEGRPMALKPGQRYTFSAWLKADEMGTKVRLGLREVGGDDAPGEEVETRTDWRRYSVTFTAACRRNRRYFLSLSSPSGASFRVDGVQLEEGEAAPWAPARDYEAGLVIPRAKRFPALGDKLAIRIEIAAAPNATPAGLNLWIRDLQGNSVLLHPLRVKPPGYDLTWTPAQPGFYSIAAVDTRQDPPYVFDEVQVCVVRPLEADQRDPFFGSHGSVGTPGEYHAPTVLAQGGCAAWRLHDMGSYAQWFLAEPEQGTFVWFDDEVTALRDRGMEVLGVFGRTAPWAGKDPGGEQVDSTAWPPRDWDEFGNYVFQVVDHYKDRIKHWEVWNEPWGRGFWAGTPEEYAKLLEVAYTQCKKADPECVVIGGCFWPPRPEFTDAVLAAGAIKFMDAVSYHHYVEPDAIAMGQVKSWYQAIRDKIDAAGGQELPLWMTEGGTHCPSYYHWLDMRDQARGAAATVAKHLIETKSLGVQRFFYYHAWQEIGSPRMFHWLLHNHWVQLEYDGAPKPIFATYAAAAYELANAVPAGSVEQGPWHVHLFRKGDAVVLALWATGALLEPDRLVVDLGDKVTVHDQVSAEREVERAGNSCVLQVTTDPLYITVQGVAVDELVSRLQQACQG